MEIKENGSLRLGIDVGSTTVKAVVTASGTAKLLYARYLRHFARQAETTVTLLKEIAALYPEARFLAAVCGSGGKPVAEGLAVPYVQEVVANAEAVRRLYPQVSTAVELGGQDAKVIFFYRDPADGSTRVSDMRMNGICAGGTGAFLDEIAALLDVEPENLEKLAARGRQVFDISGRCGVFAKTDIQPLLLQGAAKEDIALSALHAVAKQTIGGLSQGLELKPPVIFEGGPLSFNPSLIRVFQARLGLNAQNTIVPEHPEIMVALGAALSAGRMGRGEDAVTAALLLKRLQVHGVADGTDAAAAPFFPTEEAKAAFLIRHGNALRVPSIPAPEKGRLPVYLGIDSGSTTSKLVLLDREERLIDSFYANNTGDALGVIQGGLIALRDKYASRGMPLEILGVGTTGYGEEMLARAMGADCHMVETVAHAQACTKYIPDATFLMDVGGQDMKAIWLDHGVITNITLNEACSAGCGSFLENFAAALSIPVQEIAGAAFRARHPAALGSRCTVFMNSAVIHAQREGRSPEDIMAGLCRAIIENVFTKVVRIPGPEALGDRVVVQGGTFRNLAVLRALEEYLGKDVTLSPYPGEMGAIGAALLAKRQIEAQGYTGNGSAFIGLEALDTFRCVTETGVPCPHCANHCSRTILRFSTGKSWATGNRCERGGESGQIAESRREGTDLFLQRERLLFQEYPCQPTSLPKGQTVGLPRVLEFWDSMPFWNTFFRALGFRVVFSRPSGKELYERGLPYVASDTICFPAKLVHGHIADLAEQGVDRIFMPYIMHMPPEGTDQKSPYVCSVVMGYPVVVRSAQKPEERYHIPFDTPVFHWFQEKDRFRQVCAYAVRNLGVTAREAKAAFRQAASAMESFRSELRRGAEQILRETRAVGGFAVVLAGRPYHTDALVSHRISRLFAKQGISVLTVDSLPGLDKVDLRNTRIEITNNFHTRMLSGAVLAARDEALEYVQLVSFGCGHDAVLSDEIVRIMTETAGKTPLILKVDESEANGSLRIRVQSFIETVYIRRARRREAGTAASVVRPLPEASPVKFLPADKKRRVLLIPNISREVSVLLGGILEKEHYTVKTLPIGSRAQIALGKKHVHNDICFPCQMVIGELISALQTERYLPDEVAVGMVKFQCDCRMSHYAGLLRKGLDNAGFADVPILTTDAGDTKRMHPGVFLFSPTAVIEAVWVFMMLDVLTALCRRIRPYERHPGETQQVYDRCVENIAEAIKGGVGLARRVFAACISDMGRIPYDRSDPKPLVFVTGELLVTYHPGSNFQIEDYLERNGMETIFPRVTDQLRKDFQAARCEITDYRANIPPYPFAVSALFDIVQGSLEKEAKKHPLYEPAVSPAAMYEGVRDIIPQTLSCGEGWLMAAEIDHYARQGVKSFVILQPFGCLPNHICGRGVVRRLKDRYPDIQILPLDLDPDTSLANMENRLQMMMMNQQAKGGDIHARMARTNELEDGEVDAGAARAG